MRLPVVTCCIALALAAIQCGDAAVPKAVPEPPTSGILASFDRSNIVLLGETHYSQPEHSVINSLIADPAFADRVRTIAVEFGNARYQKILDRWIAGKKVPYKQVRRVWEDTTQGAFWRAPLYARFYSYVRARNRGLPAAKRLRILLGDPPIDWKKVRTSTQLDYWLMQRDPFFAYGLQKNLAAGGGTTLVIVGAAHVLRSGDARPTLTNLLEGRARCSTDPASQREGIDWCDDLARFPSIHTTVIVPNAPNASSHFFDQVKPWRNPSFALLDGTTLGMMAAQSVIGYGSPEPLQNISDALLYLGRN
jgi:hypothetical protein